MCTHKWIWNEKVKKLRLNTSWRLIIIQYILIVVFCIIWSLTHVHLSALFVKKKKEENEEEKSQKTRKETSRHSLLPNYIKRYKKKKKNHFITPIPLSLFFFINGKFSNFAHTDDTNTFSLFHRNKNNNVLNINERFIYWKNKNNWYVFKKKTLHTSTYFLIFFFIIKKHTGG